MHYFVSAKSQSEILKLRSLNRKRIPTKTIQNPSLLPIMLDDPEAVFLIPEMSDSLINAISFCNRNNIPVAVLNTASEDMPFLTFSGIYCHFYEAIKTVIGYCIGANKKQLALFGFNNTILDIKYTEAVYNLYPDFNQEDFFQIFYGFNECFERFFDVRERYDSILFPNDYIAIAFLEKMHAADPEYAKSRFIIGISDSIMSKLYFTSLTSLTYEQDSMVRAVASFYRTSLRNKGCFTSVEYLLPPVLHVRESTHSYPPPRRFFRLDRPPAERTVFHLCVSWFIIQKTRI